MPNGASAVLNIFPIGDSILPIPPIPDEIIFPILPSGDLAITPPTPESMLPSFPPIAENGLSNVVTILLPTPENTPPSFPAALVNGLNSVPPKSPSAFPTFPKYDKIPEPAVLSFPASPVPSIPAIIDFARKVSSTIFAAFMPFLTSRNPSLPTSPATLSPASAATTAVIVFTTLGFFCAKSDILVTSAATLSAAFPTIGRNVCPRTIERLEMLFLAFSIFAAVVFSIFANASSVAFALSIMPCTLSLNPSTPSESNDTAALPASALPNISERLFPLADA